MSHPLLDLSERAKAGKLPVENAQDIRTAIAEVAHLSHAAVDENRGLGERVEALTKAQDVLKQSVEDGRKAITDQATTLEEIRTAISADPNHARRIDPRALRGVPVLFETTKDMVSQGMDSARLSVLSLGIDELRMYAGDDDTAQGVVAFRRLGDVIAVYDATAQALARQNPNIAEGYAKAGGWRSHPLAGRWEALRKVIQPAAMEMRAGSVATTNAGEGLEWQPTLWGSADIRVTAADLALVSYFEQTQLPSIDFKNPVTGYTFKSSKVAESTAPGETAIPYTTFVTSNMTWNAKTHSALVAFSMQASLNSLLPIMTQSLTRLGFAIEWGREDGILNGQLSSVFDTNAAIPATDPRKLFDGLRWAAQQTTVRVDGGGSGLVADRCTLLKAQLGRWGRSPSQGLWITGFMGYALLLNLKASDGSPVVLTQDKVGPSAAIRTGEFGLLFGSPIYVADDFPQDMDANGVRTPDGTTTGMLYVNKTYIKPGRFLATQIMASEHLLFLSNQVAVKANAMDAMAFVEPPSNTKTFVGRIDNLALPSAA